MFESTFTVRCRVRLNGRLEDPQEKWRDEMIQEVEITKTTPLAFGKNVEEINKIVVAMEAELFKNLAAAGGKHYTVRKLDDTHLRLAQKCPLGVFKGQEGILSKCSSCEYRFRVQLNTADSLIYTCNWPGWGKPQEDVVEVHVETEAEVIARTGDTDIPANEVLKDCPATLGEHYEICPIDEYDGMESTVKGEALIWMMEGCTLCPKYKKWNEAREAP